MKSIKKTQTIQVPINQAITTPQEYTAAVEKAYKRIVGIAVVPRGASSTDLRLRIRTDAQTYLDWAPVSLYSAGTNYPVLSRFIPVDIPATGQNFFFESQMNAAGTGTGTIDVVFALSNGEG